MSLTAQAAIEAIANERAPRYTDGGKVNRRVVCADGFAVSVQASSSHYANDQSGDAPYWSREEEVLYPFATFEIGNPSEPVPSLDEWDAEGVWAWVPRNAVAALLDEHGGAVQWEATS